MFRTEEQIKEVSDRTGVPCEYVRKLGIMMSWAKLAQEDLKEVADNSSFSNLSLGSGRANLSKAVNYFEKDFLKCKLW